nr:MAG TPA: hypothetical protein [Caudoviricetes sp.]DAR99911.1 MAG TPA: hypothetical protein [Caudoviricetes sp.]
MTFFRYIDIIYLSISWKLNSTTKPFYEILNISERR